MLTPVMLQEEDLAQIEHLHQVQERFLGKPVDRPNLLAPPVLLAVGFADENGKIVGGCYFEAVPELCFFGNSPEATAAAVEYSEVMADFLKMRGFRWARSFPPKELSDKLEASYAGAHFHPVKTLDHFARFLAGEKGAEHGTE